MEKDITKAYRDLIYSNGGTCEIRIILSKSKKRHKRNQNLIDSGFL